MVQTKGVYQMTCKCIAICTESCIRLIINASLQSSACPKNKNLGGNHHKFIIIYLLYESKILKWGLICLLCLKMGAGQVVVFRYAKIRCFPVHVWDLMWIALEMRSLWIAWETEMFPLGLLTRVEQFCVLVDCAWIHRKSIDFNEIRSFQGLNLWISVDSLLEICRFQWNPRFPSMNPQKLAYMRFRPVIK